MPSLPAPVTYDIRAFRCTVPHSLTRKTRTHERHFRPKLVAFRRICFSAMFLSTLLSARLITWRARFIPLPSLPRHRFFRLTRELRIARRIRVVPASLITARSLHIRHVPPITGRIRSHGSLLHSHHLGCARAPITSAVLVLASLELSESVGANDIRHTHTLNVSK